MFDSGFGGLTVARAFIDLLPHEDLVYLGDTARYPYGPKPHDQVRSHAVEIADRLVGTVDPKLLVVACNTATAVALEVLTERLDIPVVGVVEPGVRALLGVTRTRRVGVIATVGTVASGAYQKAVRGADPRARLTIAACPGLVEFVERGETDSDQVRVLVRRLLAPLSESGIDALLLGCTHYPFLARTIGEVMGPEVVLVSSADETAFAVRDELHRRALARPAGGRPGRHRFVSTGDPGEFARLGRRLFGPEIVVVDSPDAAVGPALGSTVRGS